MKYFPLLFLVGCATYPYPDLSYDELYQQASDCKSAKAIGCDPLWDEIQRRDVSREKREARIEANTCPQDLVLLTDRHGDKYCITRWQSRQILNGRQNRGFGR